MPHVQSRLGLALPAALALGVLAAPATPPRADDVRPVGWASVDGGTTGGGDGPAVEAKDAAAFLKLVRGDAPAVIRVTGTIRLTDPARVGSNKTIVGVGTDAALVGGGLHLRKVHNVIVRNLAISDAPDAVSIEDGTHHVWVDHCTLFKCADGLLDVKRGSDLVTVSWCHFRDHHKTSLVGHSDKPEVRTLDAGKLRVTYHHNYFDGTKTRHPRVRYTETVHVFNNYFRGNDHGVHSSMDAGVLVEGNYFEDVGTPLDTMFGDSPDPGRLVERDNLYVRCRAEPRGRGTVREIGDAYKYTLDRAADVSALVKAGAGAGRAGR